MQPFDMIMLIIIFMPTLIGFVYGYLAIVLTLLVWALALGLAVAGVSMFTPTLAPFINMPTLRTLLAFAGLFTVSLMILSGIGLCFSTMIGKSPLVIADRMLGAFFGFGLGLVLVVCMVFLAGFTILPQQLWWEDAQFLQLFERFALWLGQYLPEEISAYQRY